MSSRFTNQFYLEHVTGDKLYPVKIKNRSTGRIAYRLSIGDTGGNTLEASIDVDCDKKMQSLVAEIGDAVRAATHNKKRSGLYKLGMWSINRAVML